MTDREAVQALFNEYHLEEHVEMVRDEAKYDPAFKGLSAEHPRVTRFLEVCRTLKAALGAGRLQG